MTPRLALAVLLVMAVSFAACSDYLKLDHTEVGFGKACTYYNITNSLASAYQAKNGNSLSISQWNFVKGAVVSTAWEQKAYENTTVRVWKQNVSCKAAGNYTVCSGEWENVSMMLPVWKPLDTSTISFAAKETKEVRFCGNFTMNKKDGAASVAIDHVPRFMSCEYKEYAWWNATWLNNSCTVITQSAGTRNFYINLTAQSDIGDEIRWTTNASGTETEASGYWKVLNGTGTKYILNVSLNSGDTQVCYYYGNVSPVGLSAANNISKACQVGDDFSGSTLNSGVWGSCSGTCTVGSGMLDVSGAVYTAGVQSLNNATYQKGAIIWRGYTAAADSFLAGFAQGRGYGVNSAIVYRSGSTFSNYVYVGSADKRVATNLTGDAAWRNWETYWTAANTNVTVSYSGSERMNRTAATPLVNMSVNIFSGGGAGIHSYYDWICSYEETTSEGFNFGVSAWANSSTTPPAVVATLTLSSAAPATYETQNSTLYLNLSGNFNMTAVNATFTYNNTVVYVYNATGLNTNFFTINATMLAPLVPGNGTTVTYQVHAYTLMGGNQTDNSTAGTHTVYEWYVPSAYGMAYLNSTVEAGTSFNMSFPGAPAGSQNVTYAYSYTLPFCYDFYANGTSANSTCTNRTLTPSNITSATLAAAHLYQNGLIYTDVFLVKSYNISFNQTPESTSWKNISTAYNTTREYYAWLVNSSNGTINGTGNLSTVLSMNFIDQTNFTSINIDSMIAQYNVTFSDGATKMYTISYQGSNALNVATTYIRAYPNASTFNITGSEIYAKTAYTTRARFIASSATNFSVPQNITIYMLPASSASVATINVVNNGAAVSGAYVQIQEYFSSTSTYLSIDQKITNIEGQAQFYGDMTQYYKFLIYDAAGGLQYTTATPQQFIYSSSAGYSITINIANTSLLNWQRPYFTASCSGVNTTNGSGYFTFSFSDATGLASTYSFYAWRDGNRTPFCNTTITGSSGGYVCYLPAYENFSLYTYTCAVGHTASPFVWDYFQNFDWRNLISGYADWKLVGYMFILGVGSVGLMVHPAIGIAGAIISMVVLSVMGILTLPQPVIVGIFSVGIVLAYIMLKEDDA